MSTRKGRIISCMVSLGRLLIGGVMLIPRSVSETSELPRQDVIQIGKTIRREIWRKAVPSRWSRAALRRLPDELWRASHARISPTFQWDHYNDGGGYLYWVVEVLDRQGDAYDVFHLQKKSNRWVVIASM
jgi:hypothetical protein